MTNTMTVAALVLLIEAGILIWATLGGTPCALHKRAIMINMIFIALFGPALITFGHGLETNVTALCYPAVIAAQLIILEIYGPDETRHAIGATAKALLCVFGLMMALHALQPAPGSEARMAAMHTITETSSEVVAALFAAFYLSQAVLVRTWAYTKRCGTTFPARAILAMIAGELAYCSTFFITAFWGHVTLTALLDMVSISFVIKVGFGLLLMPIVVVAVRYIPALQARLAEGESKILSGLPLEIRAEACDGCTVSYRFHHLEAAE